MNDNHEWNVQHQQTLENIPWLVNDRLTAVEHASASLHIAQCPSCQQELSVQQRIRTLMLCPEPIEIAPQASFHKLRSRIEEMERELPGEAPRLAASSLLGASAAGATPSLTIAPGLTIAPSLTTAQNGSTPAPSWLRPMMLGQLAAAIAAASVLLWTVIDRWSAPRFQTALSVPASLSGSISGSIGPALRVVVAPSMTMAEFSDLMESVGAHVVAGPNTQRAWTIQLPASTDAAARDALLARWHKDGRLLFAEPVMQSGGP